MRTPHLAWALAALGMLHADSARAQSGLELGVQVAAVHSGEFDATDTGFGGRLSWRPGAIVGFEAEVNIFPQDFPDGRPFSSSRVEGLFGATAGATFDRIRPFARTRIGVVAVQEAPEPFACILIFPPPLNCELASGRNLLAIDVGGGVDIGTTSRTFVRIDLGDRLVRYPGPVFTADRVVRDSSFFVHELRIATGFGVRF